MPKRVLAAVFSALDSARREASSSGGKRSAGGWREVVGALESGLGAFEAVELGFEDGEAPVVCAVLSTSVGPEEAGVLLGCG